MRKAALLALPLALSGCSGMGKFFHDTSVLSGSNPNAPRGDSVNIRRVRGENVAIQPILPENGNMWPGTPQPLPTLKDVEDPNSFFSRALGDPATYFGGANIDKNFMGGGIGGSGPLGARGPQMPSGQSMSVGESTDAHYGVSLDRSHMFPPLPSSVPDNASRFMGKNPNGTIVIPNGDGTSTLIAPDGTVHVVGGKASISRPNKKK
ncbi:hypothetical protein [Swingsia samuiensis]|uniref:Uncharacterized protein n=1 Tax=Swingsia samuiensis TaxID=1293412 RepID=A0A4Y6UN50_9PROT|nr:hypothetical protein [Swingsia samuiensis]QDH17816.1 hypothetical protein E3D00_09735 [Swingsia samuiensis]